MKPYKTLLRRGSDEIIIKNSRFIGEGVPVDSEDAALAFLGEVRKSRPDASHHCYAYILGEAGGAARFSDDGEPGGTAGLQITEALKRMGVTNLCVAVSRYFGGVLLGAGGLSRAYSKAATLAVYACGVGEMHPTLRCLIEADYPDAGKLDHFLAGSKAAVEGKEFAQTVTYTVAVREVDSDALAEGLRDRFDGKLELVTVEGFHMAWGDCE